MHIRSHGYVPSLLICVAAVCVVSLSGASGLHGSASQSHIGRVVVKNEGPNKYKLVSFTAPKVRHDGKFRAVAKSDRQAASWAATQCRQGRPSFFVRTSAFGDLWDVNFAVECRGFAGVKLVPLLTGYKSKGKRHMPIVEPLLTKRAERDGYRTRRVLAQISRNTRKGTRPLFLYHHAERNDYRAASTQQNIEAADKDGYKMAGLLGYVFKTPADLKAAYPKAHPVWLSSVYNAKRKDSMMIVVGQGGRKKNPKGYANITNHHEGWAAASPRMK